MEPILEAVDAERDDLRIVTVDTDADPQLAAAYEVMGLPTMILFRHGAEQMRIRGFLPRSRLAAALEQELEALS